MAVPFKLHTVTVTRPESEGEVPVQASPVSVRGMMAPENPTTVYERFGVSLDKPWVFFTEKSNADLFEQGGHVEWRGNTYQIDTIRTFDHGLPADHTAVVLAEQ